MFPLRFAVCWIPVWNGLRDCMSEDSDKKIRKSHENPSIQKLYAEFLEKPNSHKAHELLHTFYAAKPKFS